MSKAKGPRDERSGEGSTVGGKEKHLDRHEIKDHCALCLAAAKDVQGVRRRARNDLQRAPELSPDPADTNMLHLVSVGVDPTGLGVHLFLWDDSSNSPPLSPFPHSFVDCI